MSDSIPSHDVLDRSDVLGAQLRALRQSREQTLEEVAAASGLSKGYLSLVESGKRTPHWPTLLRILHALDGTLCGFLTAVEDVSPSDDGVRTRRKDLLVVSGAPPDRWGHPRDDDSGYTWILTPYFEGIRSEVVELRLPPHTTWAPAPLSFNARVVLYALEGRILLEEIGENRDEFVAEEGETLQYDARNLHQLRNYTDVAARALLVISPAQF